MGNRYASELRIDRGLAHAILCGATKTVRSVPLGLQVERLHGGIRGLPKADEVKLLVAETHTPEITAEPALVLDDG